MMKRYLLAVALLLAPAAAFPQATVIQGGTWTPGHVPAYGNSSGQPTVRDGGTAAGNASPGTNPSTLGLTSRCANPPCDGSVNSQGGPNGENFAIFDAPTADTDGYHYLGFSANVGGKAVITTGAGGGAAAQGLDFIIDGTTYNFPGDFPTIPVTVPQGGTGLTSLPAHDLLVGNGTGNVTLIAPSATSGVPLVSQGSSADPAYGTVAIAGGGTGATTANDALNNLLPTQSMQNGKVLSTDGTNSSWVNIPGTGTVTSVTFNNGLTSTINPCVAACTASLDINGLTVDGSPDGSADYLATYDASASTNKKVLINTLPVLLSQLSALSQAQGDVIYFNGTNWVRLGAGTNGYALITQGAASNPVWSQYLINNLAIASQAQGDVVYYNGSNWTRLGAGTSGQFLQTQGAGANPQWASATTAMPGYIYGVTLSNNVSDATNDIDIAAGRAAENTNGVVMVLASALTKRTDANWAVGTNQGCLDTGAVGNNTYHIFLIQRSDTSVTDVLCSLSASAPTMPANYDRSRRIGSIIRSGGTILGFSQRGDQFLLKALVTSVNSTVGTTAASYTVTVPTGIQVDAMMNIFADGTAGTAILVSSLDQNDDTPARSTAFTNISFTGNEGEMSNPLTIRTNTSAQVRGRSDQAGVTFVIATSGWLDTRDQ